MRHRSSPSSASGKAQQGARGSLTAGLPAWISPQLTQLVDKAPEGDQWLHELKYDGYRMHARLDRGAVKLLTRTGLDWTHKYPAIAKAGGARGTPSLDGELCGVGSDGSPCSTSSSSLPTAATQQRWSSFCSILPRRQGSPAAAAVMSCA
jgi:ATP-dependent DNA ligase